MLLDQFSFDNFATADAALMGWTLSAATISAGNGRRGTKSLRITTAGSATLTPLTTPTGATVVHGFSANPSVITAGTFWNVQDATVTHLTLLFVADGSVTMRRGTAAGTVLGSSAAGVFVAGVTNYVEVKALIDDTVGTVEVRVNGVAVLTLTGQDTRNGGTAGWTKVSVQMAGAALDVDDMYLLDGTGSAPNNTFLGDVRCDYHVPTANGNTSGSTPSTGSNRALNVDDTAQNGDTDYNTLAATNDKDTLVLTDLIAAGAAAIYGIKTTAFAKKTDAAAGSLALVTRSGGTDNDGSSVALTTGYTALREQRETDPNTGVAWTESGFNAMETGYKRTA